MNSKLEQAIEICGGQTRLANALGVRQPHVWNWLHRPGRGVPAEHCRTIEDITNGAVTRYDLRPDVFGENPVHEKAA